MAKTALILGATGLVGKSLLRQLLERNSYDKIICPVRRSTSMSDKRVEEILTDFSDPEKLSAKWKADHFFITMGTTIRKAKTKENFRRVDLEIPLQVAGILKKNGATLCSIVTAIGANASSPVFYSRTKGEIERDLANLGFDHLQIFRPSFLAGNREEQRAGEKVGVALTSAMSFLLQGPLKTYRAISADTVASVMADRAGAPHGAREIFESQKIQELFDAGSK